MQPLVPPNQPISSGGGPGIIGTLQVSGTQVFVNGTPVRSGSEIYSGDRVATGAGSSCLVNLAGGGSIQLDENTDPLFTLLRQGLCILVEIGSGQVFEDTPGQCIHFKTPDGSAQSDTKVNIDLRSGSTVWTVAQGEVRLNPPVDYVVRPYEQVTVSRGRMVDSRRVTAAELVNIIAWRRKHFRVSRVVPAPTTPPAYVPPSTYVPAPTYVPPPTYMPPPHHRPPPIYSPPPVSATPLPAIPSPPPAIHPRHPVLETTPIARRTPVPIYPRYRMRSFPVATPTPEIIK